MSIITGIKVGTTDITAEYTDSVSKSDIQSLEVTAVELKSIDTPDNCVYTGYAFEVIPSVHAIVNDKDTVLIKDTDYSLSYVNNINAGTATVTATGKNNFTGTVSATWTILNADITVSYSDQSYTYNGNVQGSGIIVSTVNSQVPTVRYGLSEDQCNLINIPQFTNVSESGTVYYKVTAPNHNDATGSYKLEIKPETAYLVWGTLSWMYDGKEHSTTCEVSNLIGDDTCTVNLTGNSITNIGSTTVTAISLSNSNYALSSTESKTLTIEGGFFTKINGIWTPVKNIYRKISGAWVLQESMTSLDINEKYVKKE